MDHRYTVLALAPLACLALCAQAQARPPQDPWFTDLELATEAPLSLGPRLVIEGPHRVRVGAQVGWLPDAYVDLINGATVALGGYDQQVARLVELALDDSAVTRFDVGWRPWAEHGFYFQLGYRYVTFGGQVEGAQIADLIGVELPSRARPYAYQVDASLHMLDLELGWQWFLPWGILLRAGTGLAATFTSSATVDAVRTVDQYEDTATARLNDIFANYGFSPLLTFAVGYRFSKL
jgi:hypothetical protein